MHYLTSQNHVLTLAVAKVFFFFIFFFNFILTINGFICRQIFIVEQFTTANLDEGTGHIIVCVFIFITEKILNT